MRFIAEWLRASGSRAVVATVLGSKSSIAASSDTVVSEGAADEAVLNIVHKINNIKNNPFNKLIGLYIWVSGTKGELS
jgi:hypothetical protein